MENFHPEALFTRDPDYPACAVLPKGLLGLEFGSPVLFRIIKYLLDEVDVLILQGMSNELPGL